jgi:hypothetical protein
VSRFGSQLELFTLSMIAKLRATAAHLGFVTTDYSKTHYSDL